MALQKRNIDVVKVFLTFLSFQGNVSRTALALDMREEDVAVLASQERWAEKLANYAALREEDQNVQISINRALSYIQSCQLSQIIDAVIQRMSDPDKLEEMLTSVTKSGSTFSTKPITDLVRAAQAVQAMKAAALGDVGTPIQKDDAVGGSLGVKVANALSAVQSNPGVDAVTIVQKSLNDASGLCSLPPGGAA